METEKSLLGYKYQASPKYNNLEFKNFQTPKISIKNESSETILNQTKESLNNFLLNLKNCSILKDNSERRNFNVVPKISGLSSISNTQSSEEKQSSYGLNNNINNNNNLETNILNYNKIYNTNNVYNLGNNSLIKNKAKLRANKQTEPFQQIHEKFNTESDLNLYFNNNLYNTLNINKGKTDFPAYNTAKRIKNNFSMGKNYIKSEEKRTKQDSKLVINLKEKIKILKSENLKNKNDILYLANTYNEMQKTLLDKIIIMTNEKDNKIKELEKKIKEMKEIQKEKETISEKNNKLIKDIESLNNEIKKLNKNNKELQKTIKDKDIIIAKANEELKELEEKLNKISVKDVLKYELKEKEEELNTINGETDNKLRSYQELLIEYKTSNNELLKENKTITGFNNILKSQKKQLTKENNTNKQMAEELKIENEKLLKERDEYKIKKEKLINEIEIIKLNNDRIYNIKSITNNNTNKLKNEISSLKKEKEILGEKNEELKKRIKSLDRKNSQNKSLKSKSKTVANLKKDKYNNLKIIKIKEFTISINNNAKNKNLNKKDTPKKALKKVVNKFKKLSIINKVVEININKKRGNNNKKVKKIINKFKKISFCSKIVDISIKSKPKPQPKPKKKKFMKLKLINEVVNICLKSKINNKKFKSNKLKISSKINSLNINSFNEKKKIYLKKSNTEFIFFEKLKEEPILSENKNVKEINNVDSEIPNKEKTKNNIIYEINKLNDIKFEGKIKTLIFDINKIENFSLIEKTKEKSINKNLIINKNETITYLNISKINKKIDNYTIDNNIKSFNILSNTKIIKPYEISTNNLITFLGQKRAFINIENKKSDFFDIISKAKPNKITFEISKHETFAFIKKCKIFKFNINNSQNFMYRGIKLKKNSILKKEKNTSLFFKPKKKVVLLSKSTNEQATQNKPKLMSFFSSFIKPKKSNMVPMRILTVQYRKSKKEKLSELNKRNSISKQNKLNFLPIQKKKKEIKYTINNTFSFNIENLKRISKFDIININSFSFEKTKKKIDLSLVQDPDMLKGEENLKQLIEELNIAITLKNEEIKRLQKEKADSDLANQLFNESSNEQIETLSNSLSLIKEKNEKLNGEIQNLKEEINNNKNQFEETNKQFDEKKNNLNKTIEDLTKENSQLKLQLFKKGTETENNIKEKQEEKNNMNNDKLKEYEKQVETLKEDLNKMRQSKIIETNQLKLELAKNKVEMKRLENQIKKLELEKNQQKKEGGENIPNLKIIEAGKEQSKGEIDKLKMEIENYKNKMNEMNIELKKNEELRHQNILFTHKLQEAQKKIAQANQVIARAKKFGLVISYVTQFLGLIKPENEKQIYLFNKLKEFADEFQKEKSGK